MAGKDRVRYDSNEVEDLLRKARNEETSGKYFWVERLDQQGAREELIRRFTPLLQSLFSIIKTGNYNSFIYSQTRFLKLFVGPGVPLQKMAVVLKKELEGVTEEELHNIGVQAILESIPRAQTSLVGTIVGVLKDKVYEIIKNQNANKMVQADIEDRVVLLEFAPDDELERVNLEVVLGGCTEEDQIILKEIMDGTRKSLKALPEEQQKRLQSVFNFLIEG